MRRLFFVLIGCIGYTILSADSGQDWTWFYKKIFSDNQVARLHSEKERVFSKEDTQPFTQLLFSWNAVRPEDGHFQFLAQVRNAKTKQWGDWHTMAEWGAHVQRSFYNTVPTGSKYCYVRLEVPGSVQADGFRIKVVAKKTDLSGMRGLFVSIADYNLFKRERIDTRITDLPSVAISGVPLQSQKILDHPKKDSICSPTITSVLVSYLLGHRISPVEFAQKAYDTGLSAYGSWPFNTAHAYEMAQGKALFMVRRMQSFADVHHLLCQGMPVIVSVRGNIEGAAKIYDEGHLLMIVGWHKKTKKVLCRDSAFLSNKQTAVAYDIHSFLPAWEQSRRLAYCAQLVD